MASVEGDGSDVKIRILLDEVVALENRIQEDTEVTYSVS